MQHRVELFEDFAIGEADDMIAVIVEVLRAGLIVLDLMGMAVAVDFNAQPGFGAIEVDDEVTDDMLTATPGGPPALCAGYGHLESVNLSVAQARPQFYFGGRLRLAQFTSCAE